MARRKTLYSLLDVKKKTGISYPTLVKYARDLADQIPTVGQGRNRGGTAAMRPSCPRRRRQPEIRNSWSPRRTVLTLGAQGTALGEVDLGDFVRGIARLANISSSRA